MGKQKYLESKRVETMSQAVERILLDSILPNAQMKFESVEWRKTFLWTLEVDDLLKANMDNLKRLFAMIKKGIGQFLRFDDVINFI